MIWKKSKNTFTAQPFSTILLKGISLIILIFTSTENIYGETTSIIGVDLVSESVPNIVAFLALDRSVEENNIRHNYLASNRFLKNLTPYRKNFIFFHAFSKNIFLKHKENLIEIKLFSCKIGYRASYNYNIKTRLIDKCNLFVKDSNLQNLTLTHDHVYDLLSISYGKNYKIKGSMYYRVNIGLSINFPGEFYHTHMFLHPINLKGIRRYILCFNSNDERARNQFIVYNHIFHKYILMSNSRPVLGDYYDVVSNSTSTSQWVINIFLGDYYDVVFKSTSTSQWIINILLGLIENIFVEYSIVMPIGHFLVLYPLHIHISIGTILGTIEWLYRYFKEEDKRGFLGYFYTLFCMQSIAVFKIGYYE